MLFLWQAHPILKFLESVWDSFQLGSNFFFTRYSLALTAFLPEPDVVPTVELAELSEEEVLKGIVIAVTPGIGITYSTKV